MGLTNEPTTGTPTTKEVRRALRWAKENGNTEKAALLSAYLKQRSEESITKRCRLTGTKITVCTAEQAGAGFDGTTEGLPWYTVCDTHSYCVGHHNKKTAIEWASHPSWCEKCQLILEGKAPKHPTGDPSGDDQEPA